MLLLTAFPSVNNFGGFWAPKGNGGTTNVIGTAGQAVLPSPLNSMYRKIKVEGGKYKVDKTMASLLILVWARKPVLG